MPKRMGIFHEIVLLIKEKKSYWLIPIFIIIAAILGLIAVSVMTGGAATPLIYTLF